MHKCIKAGLQLLVDIGATNAGRGNWGEGSLFVGGFVAICCVLIALGEVPTQQNTLALLLLCRGWFSATRCLIDPPPPPLALHQDLKTMQML